MFESTASMPGKVALSLLALFAAVACFCGLSFRELESGDETRVAGISAEMFHEKDFVTPHLNGKPFLEYPPAFYWADSAAFAVFGINDAAAKLPSAVSAFCAALLLFLLARDMGMSPAVSLTTGVLWLSCAQIFSYARICMVDMMLAAFMLLTWYAFYGFWVRENRFAKAGFFLLTTAGLVGGVMTKGLIAIALPVSSIGIYLVLSDIAEKKFRFLRYLLLTLALLAAALPVAYWLHLLYNHSGADALHTVLWTNNIGRFVGTQTDHAAPWYDYFLKLPGLFQPWLILLLAAFFFLAKRVQKKTFPSAMLYPLCMLLVSFVILCIASGKRQVYLLPLYAPCALLAAWFLKEEFLPWIENGSAFKRFSARISRILLAAWCVFMVTLILLLPMKGAFTAAYAFPLLGILAGLAGVLIPKGTMSFPLRTGYLLCAFACTLVSVDVSILAKKIQNDTVRELFADCMLLESAGAHIVLPAPQERTAGAANFYLGKNLPVRERLTDAELKAGPPPGEYWIIREKRRNPGGIRYGDSHYLIPPKQKSIRAVPAPSSSFPVPSDSVLHGK